MSTNPLPTPAEESSPVDDILDALSCLDVADRGDAGALADRVIDRVIRALQRDARIPRLNRMEFELLLSDARLDIERDIAEQIDGTVNLGDVIDAVEEASTEEAP